MARYTVGLCILVAAFGGWGAASAHAASDLSIATTRDGDFVVGQSAAFVLTVTNQVRTQRPGRRRWSTYCRAA